MMVHYLEDFRVTSNWPDGEELHYDTLTIYDDYPTDKQVVSIYVIRRKEFPTNATQLAFGGMLLK